ncbi:MAG: N-acetyltransferase [Candidatus Omnitrophica bacterium]|nr:N-acetyltransferase [Candidatus Omnitrophota bacterium]
MKTILRKADLRDVPQIQGLIAIFAKQDLMLSRSLMDIYENIRDYFVVAKGKKFVGCCALHICWENLAEIKALAVDTSAQGSGIGKKLIKVCLKEAKELKIKKLFCLTYVPEFFKPFGFKKISRRRLPHKIWTECLQCPKFPHCDEQAMLLKL